MQLTLGNELIGTVSREVDEASRRASGLGESLTTGLDKFVEVVDGFLGHSLKDSEIVLGAIAKNTAYSINMLTITEEYLKTIATSLQKGLKTIGSAGPLSADKLAVLQKNLDDKKSQVALLVRTANFDGKSLLSGGASKVNVQVGLSIADKLTIRVSDISIPKLFRIGATNAINNWIAADINRTSAYINQADFNDAVVARHNFTQDVALTNAELSAAIVATRTGNASFARLETKPLLIIGHIEDALKADVSITTDLNTDAIATAAITALVNGFDNGDDTATIVAAVNAAASGAAAVNNVNIGNAAETLVNNILGAATLNATLQAHTLIAGNNPAAIANAVDAAIANGINLGHDKATISAAVNDAAFNASGNQVAIGDLAASIYFSHSSTKITINNAPQQLIDIALGYATTKAQLLANFADNQPTNLTNEAGLALAQEVFTEALNVIRAEQAAVANQQQNIIEAADALRATTNVTQKAADSYLKTDYVMTAQQYSETIRTMVAAITSLQAANKIPEAAQRLIDALAR